MYPLHPFWSRVRRPARSCSRRRARPRRSRSRRTRRTMDGEDPDDLALVQARDRVVGDEQPGRAQAHDDADVERRAPPASRTSVLASSPGWVSTNAASTTMPRPPAKRQRGLSRFARPPGAQRAGPGRGGRRRPCPGANASASPTRIERPARRRTSRPVSVSTNAAIASPRSGSLPAATAATTGVAAPSPASSAPATASVMPTARIASHPVARPDQREAEHRDAEQPDRDPQPDPPADRVTWCRRPSSARSVADASSTFAGSFFASDGLIVCSAERIVVEACCASMSTRRPLAAAEHLLVRPHREVADRVLDRRRRDRRRDRVGDGLAGGGDEVRRAGEAQRRLVGDVVPHRLALRRLGDDVGEALVVEHAGVEPPAERGERDEEAPAERPGSARPSARTCAWDDAGGEDMAAESCTGALRREVRAAATRSCGRS